jgi:hypothetical protein
MGTQQGKHRGHRVTRIHMPEIAEALLDTAQEFVLGGRALRLRIGHVFGVAGTAHEKRQLRAEMGGKRRGYPVPQRAQDGAQNMPGQLPVAADIGHDLLQPDIRGLQCLVEDIQTGGAHAAPPAVPPLLGRCLARRVCSICWTGPVGAGDKNGMASSSPSPSLDPAERQRLRERFFTLIWDQVRPWAYMDTDGLELRRFDGSPLSFAPASLDGAPRQTLWESNYIEPFLEAICREETNGAAALAPPARAALREVLAAGIARVYLTMQEIDWHMHGDGVATRHLKRDVEPDVARMITYLDRCLAGSPARAA